MQGPGPKRWVVALGLAACVAADPARAEEPSPEVLAGARELFREAIADAELSRFDVALEKLRRVAAIRETSAVRYNIARCEESLARLGSALSSYELAEAEAQRDHDADALALAHEGADRVRARAPRIFVVLPEGAPGTAEIHVDRRRVIAGVPLPADAGWHKVQVAAPGFAVFTSDVEARESETTRVTVVLEILPVVADPPPPAPPPPPRPAEPRGLAGREIAALGLGAGSIALAGGAVSLALVHNTRVSDLRAACTPACPLARRDELEAARRSAAAEETAAWILGGAAFATAGAAVVLYFYKPRRTVWHVTPTATPAGAFLTTTARF